jgi:hypothetical protein
MRRFDPISKSDLTDLSPWIGPIDPLPRYDPDDPLPWQNLGSSSAFEAVVRDRDLAFSHLCPSRLQSPVLSL